MANDIKFPKKVFTGKGEVNASFRTTLLMNKALDVAAEANNTSKSNLISFILDQWLQMELKDGNKALKALLDEEG